MQLEKFQLIITGFEDVGRGSQTKEYGSIQQMSKNKTKINQEKKNQFCKQQENRDLSPIKVSN